MVQNGKSLGDLPIGARAIVRRVRCARPLACRLMEMGLLPGTLISITRVAPLGDPVVLRVRNYALSIRRAEAMLVDVEQAPADAERGP